MMRHRQPLTSSSAAGWDRRLRERASAEGFFASTKEKLANSKVLRLMVMTVEGGADFRPTVVFD